MNISFQKTWNIQIDSQIMILGDFLVKIPVHKKTNASSKKKSQSIVIGLLIMVANLHWGSAKRAHMKKYIRTGSS